MLTGFEPVSIVNGLDSEVSVAHAFSMAVHQEKFRLFACWHPLKNGNSWATLKVTKILVINNGQF